LLLTAATSFLEVNACRADDAAAQRRQRIENMTPAEKKQLKGQLDWFAALKPEERERIRQLHQQLEDSPNAEQLRRVMRAYCTWLKSQPLHVPLELANLPPAQRIKRIRELRAEEARRPKLEDMEGLLRWMKEFAADPKHQAEFLKGMPEPGRESFPKFGGRDRNWVAEGILWQQFHPRRPGWHGWPGFSDRPDWLTLEQLAALRECLSEETAKRLARLSPDEQWEEISGWVERWRSPGFSGQGSRDGPPSQELLNRLSKFFESLSPEDQDELVNLPAVQMDSELRNRYFMSLNLMPGPDGRWEGGGPRGGRGRGDGRPPDLGPPLVPPAGPDGPGPPRGPEGGGRNGPPPMEPQYR
jgi:hypothetical protein